MAAQTAFRIDISLNDRLVHPGSQPPAVPAPQGATLPEAVFPQHAEWHSDPGPAVIPEKRQWNREQIMRKVRGWPMPYLRSRVMPGEFHPITAHLFLEYKCNIDCWYCWSFNTAAACWRDCLLLRSSGLRYSEIAEIMGINRSLVGTLVSRAVARLRDDLS